MLEREFMIPINTPIIGDEEVEAVRQVLKSGRLTEWRLEGGPMVRQLEKAFSSYIGVKHSIAVSSGTAALHSALLAIGLRRGMEVIVPTFTFVATANAVLMTGAKPIFVDIDLNTYNIDVDEVKKALTKKTKAIIPVHLYGLPVDMDPIMELAEEKGLYVIEDAAQAHGAEYKGRKVGILGHVACFSFYSSKVITTGEGGMVTTNDDELAYRLRSIRTHGQREGYDTERVGNNYRMTEMQAAIGLVQLSKIEGFLKIRRKNSTLLTDGLSNIKHIHLPMEPPQFKHCWYLYTVRMEDGGLRDMMVKELNARGIGAAVYYKVPVHSTPLYYKLVKRRLPRAEEASKTVFQLPVHPKVSEDQAKMIVEETVKVLRGKLPREV